MMQLLIVELILIMKRILGLLFFWFLLFPNSAQAVSQSDFPAATQGTLYFIGHNGSKVQVNVILPSYTADCWNDLSITATLYNATTGEAASTINNSTAEHICGYLDNDHSKNWIVFPPDLPSGNYWVYVSSSSFVGYWVTNDLSYTAPDVTPTQSPSPTPSARIVANPDNGTATAGTPFNIDIKVDGDGEPFNAAQANVSVSSNLNVIGITYPTANSCNFNYTKRPTKNDPSFAGAIYGGSSTGCTIYTLTIKPTATGTGTITFTDASVKAYSDSSEILTGVEGGSYTISAATATPTPTTALAQLTATSALFTYMTDYTLKGNKDSAITQVFVNGSEAGSVYPTSTTWERPVTLSVLGENTLTIYGSDGTNQTATQNVIVKKHTLGDINGDGNVDIIDASLFAIDWGKTSNFSYILSDMTTPPDGDVDLTDLSVLAKLIQQ